MSGDRLLKPTTYEAVITAQFLSGSNRSATTLPAALLPNRPTCTLICTAGDRGCEYPLGEWGIGNYNVREWYISSQSSFGNPKLKNELSLSCLTFLSSSPSFSSSSFFFFPKLLFHCSCFASSDISAERCLSNQVYQAPPLAQQRWNLIQAHHPQGPHRPPHRSPVRTQSWQVCCALPLTEHNSGENLTYKSISKKKLSLKRTILGFNSKKEGKKDKKQKMKFQYFYSLVLKPEPFRLL